MQRPRCWSGGALGSLWSLVVSFGLGRPPTFSLGQHPRRTDSAITTSQTVHIEAVSLGQAERSVYNGLGRRRSFPTSISFYSQSDNRRNNPMKAARVNE